MSSGKNRRWRASSSAASLGGGGGISHAALLLDEATTSQQGTTIGVLTPTISGAGSITLSNIRPAGALQMNADGRTLEAGATPVAFVEPSTEITALAQYTHGGGTASQTITVQVRDVNAVPVMPATANLQFTVNSPGGVSAPVNTVAPVVTGNSQVGSTLSTGNGTWTNSPSSFTYQWRADGVDIGGATSNTLDTTGRTAGEDIDCVVTATNAGGSASQDSNDITLTAVSTPSDMALSSSTAPENSTDPLVGTLSTTGGVAPFTYSILSGPATVAGDQLSLSGTFDREGIGSPFEVSVQVRVTDSLTATYDETFAIVITDVNETPTFTGPLTAQNLTENAAMTPYDVSGEFADPDAGDTLTFGLAPASNALPTGLSISTAGVISGTPTEVVASARTITIRATDGGGLTVDGTVDITVAAASGGAAAIVSQNVGLNQSANTSSTFNGVTDLTLDGGASNMVVVLVAAQMSSATHTFTATAVWDDGTTTYPMTEITKTANNQRPEVIIFVLPNPPAGTGHADVTLTGGDHSGAAVIFQAELENVDQATGNIVAASPLSPNNATANDLSLTATGAGIKIGLNTIEGGNYTGEFSATDQLLTQATGSTGLSDLSAELKGAVVSGAGTENLNFTWTTTEDAAGAMIFVPEA